MGSAAFIELVKSSFKLPDWETTSEPELATAVDNLGLAMSSPADFAKLVAMVIIEIVRHKELGPSPIRMSAFTDLLGYLNVRSIRGGANTQGIRQSEATRFVRAILEKAQSNFTPNQFAVVVQFLSNMEDWARLEWMAFSEWQSAVVSWSS